MKLYFLPEQIRYTKAQLVFLLNHLMEIQAGCWPEIDNPLNGASGGIITIGNRAARSTILFQPNGIAMKIASEVVERLKLCGDDGRILRERFVNKKSVEEVSAIFHLTPDGIFRRTNLCLKFMSGKKRRTDYQKWAKRQLGNPLQGV